MTRLAISLVGIYLGHYFAARLFLMPHEHNSGDSLKSNSIILSLRGSQCRECFIHIPQVDHRLSGECTLGYAKLDQWNEDKRIRRPNSQDSELNDALRSLLQVSWGELK